MFPPLVERWRSVAHQVEPEIPAALVLAIIRRESAGRPGLLGRSNDDGLMQCKPATVAFYNRHHEDKITHEEMSRADLDSAKKQIAVGAWYLGHCLATVHAWNPAAAPWPAGPLTDYQILLADLCYARGVAGVGKLRARALAAGYPDTFDGLHRFRETHDPTWGTPGHPFKHAPAVLAMMRLDGTGASSPPAILPAKAGGFPWSMVLGAAAVIIGALVEGDKER